jgi:hypothetical protein
MSSYDTKSKGQDKFKKDGRSLKEGNLSRFAQNLFLRKSYIYILGPIGKATNIVYKGILC